MDKVTKQKQEYKNMFFLTKQNFQQKDTLIILQNELNL